MEISRGTTFHSLCCRHGRTRFRQQFNSFVNFRFCFSFLIDAESSPICLKLNHD
uniref:Uncharacterized protein n=1 Tax=Physcomitrium patens TaxID=3218 RepID=A0A2K1KQP1_PHYPA|nr:hypothetical protein PHYPA_007001 [Physcomitrium patens]